MSLEGQRVVIIGGTSGIGRAVAQAALAAGASAHIGSSNADKLKAALALLGTGATGATINVCDEGSVEAFFADHAAFDHIVVSAAVTPIASVRDLSLADARGAMESKFWGAYHVARAAKLTERGSLTLVSGFLAGRPAAGAARPALTHARCIIRRPPCSRA